MVMPVKKGDMLSLGNREELYAKYRQKCKAAAANADLRLIDNWRMPNSAAPFDLDGFISYLEQNGEKLGRLVTPRIQGK